MGVVLIKWAWLKILRVLCARLCLQPHHSKNPRSAPIMVDKSLMFLQLTNDMVIPITLYGGN